MLIDVAEESKSGSNYLCELCDTKFVSKQAIAIHKHRKHGLQLLIEANSLPYSSMPNNGKEKPVPIIINDKDKSVPEPKLTAVVPNILDTNTPSANPVTIVDDVSDDNDNMGGGEPPSPSHPPLPMDVEEEIKPPTPEQVTKSVVEKKTSKKKAVVVKEKSKSPGVAKKSTGGFTNFKPKRKSALKAQRELKKLETDSNMRISDDELEELTSRKRPRSVTSRANSSNEFVTPRKAAVKAEKKIKSATQREERNSLSDPDEEPSTKRKCEVEEPEIKPEVKVTQMNGTSSAGSKLLEESVELDSKGRLECIFCYKVIHIGRYCAHMRKFHPAVDEFSWQVKPGEVEEIQTPVKATEPESPKVKTEASSSANRDLSNSLDTAKRESFVCSICDRSFNKRIALIQHTKNVHKMTYCCGEAFDEESYEDHKVLHDLDCFDVSAEADNTEETEAALAVFSAPLPPKSSKENVKPVKEASPQPAAPTSRGRKPKIKVLEDVERVFNCTKCISKGTENEVYDHYNRIHRVHWCFVCKTTFEKLNLLENHFNEEHQTDYKEILDFYDRGDSDITEWSCKSCKQPFKNKSRLLQHYKMKHSLLPCFICTTAFKTQEQLQQHSELCEKKTCSYCSERFTQKILFLMHELQHVDDEDIDDFRPYRKDFYSFIMENTVFRCLKCKLAFSTDKLYQRHIQKIHQGVEGQEEKAQSSGRKSSTTTMDTTCKDCNRTFVHPKYLHMHKCTATERAVDAEEEDNSSAFKCEICIQSFGSQEALRNHLEVHALGDD